MSDKAIPRLIQDVTSGRPVWPTELANAGAEADAPLASTFSPPIGWLTEDIERAQARIAQWAAESHPRDDGTATPIRPIAAEALAQQMAAWLAHLSHWTELSDDAVVLAVASPEQTEAVRITAGMIRDAAGR